MAQMTDMWRRRFTFSRFALLFVFVAALGGLGWERWANYRADNVLQFLNHLRADGGVPPSRQAIAETLSERFDLVALPMAAPDHEVLSWHGIFYRYDVNVYYYATSDESTGAKTTDFYASLHPTFRYSGSPEQYVNLLAAVPLLLLIVLVARRLGKYLAMPPGDAVMAENAMPTPPFPMRWRSALLVLAGYSGLYVLFFSPILFTGRQLDCGDNAGLYLPYFVNPWSVWDPLLACGYPRLGDPQCWTWYPPALFFGWLGWWNGLALWAYVLASSFTFGLLWRLTGSALAATAGGVIYGLSGFMMAHERHMVIVQSAAYLPLVIWALEELRHRMSGKWISILAVAAASTLLGGQPQVFVQSMAFSGLFVLVACWRVPAGLARYLLSAAAGLALGVGLTAVQLLPTLELIPLSRRREVDFHFFASYSVSLSQLPLFLFPYAHGEFWFPGSGDFHSFVYEGDPSNIEEITGYCGYLGLILAGVAIASWPKGRWPWFWLGVAILSLGAALGPDTPLGRLLFLVPGFNQFRCQGRNLMITTLAVAVLAGYGLAWLKWQPRRQGDRPLAQASLGLMALVVAAWVLLGLQMQYSNIFLAARTGRPYSAVLSLWPWVNGAIGLPLVNLAVCLSGLWAWHALRTKTAVALLVMALILDLGIFGWFAEWHRSPASAESSQMPLCLSAVADELAGAHQRLLAVTGTRNPSANWSVDNAYGYAQLGLARHAHLLSGDVMATPIPDALAVRYSISETGTQGKHWKLITQQSATAPNCVLYQNQHSSPRVRLVSHVVALDPEKILLALRSGRLPDGTVFDPLHTALVEDAEFRLEAPTDADASAQLVEHGSTRVTVKTRASGESFLVLADTHYPGWQAIVDGEPSPHACANYVLQGVRLPPGEHLVVFEFRSPILRIGLAITICCSIMAASLWIPRLKNTLSYPFGTQK